MGISSGCHGCIKGGLPPGCDVVRARGRASEEPPDEEPGIPEVGVPGQRPVIRAGRLVDGPLDQQVDDGHHEAVDQDAGFDPRQEPYGPIPTWTGHPAKGQQRQRGRDQDSGPRRPIPRAPGSPYVLVVAECPRRLPRARCPPGPSRRSRRRRAARDEPRRLRSRAPRGPRSEPPRGPDWVTWCTHKVLERELVPSKMSGMFTRPNHRRMTPGSPTGTGV